MNELSYPWSACGKQFAQIPIPTQNFMHTCACTCMQTEINESKVYVVCIAHLHKY